MDCLPPVSLKNSGNKLSQPSPTVNTREAQMLMQQMWGYQGGSSRTKETILSKSNTIFLNQCKLLITMNVLYQILIAVYLYYFR